MFSTGWSALLSRKSLLRASRHIADICGQCSLMYPTNAPTIVSACLVSLEPDSQFRMMTDQVTPDERFGQQSANSNLSTPEDASCTHILVFPTSATTRVSHLPILLTKICRSAQLSFSCSFTLSHRRRHFTKRT